MSQKISIILPTFNERENALALIAEIEAVMTGLDFEIVLVDDNSPDGTLAAVEALHKSFVKTVSRSKDRGLARSIRAGLERAVGDIFIIMDSDFNHQPRYLPFMVQALHDYDCVLASRFLYGGTMESRSRQILSWAFNVFIRLMTGGRITDNLYGFLSIRRAELERCPYDEIFWGYGDYCMRLLYELQKHKARILQFPAVNGERKYGKGNSWFLRVFWQYTRSVFRLVAKGRVEHDI